MPVYRFQGPDGRIHRAEAATPQEAQAGLEAMWAKRGATASAAAPIVVRGPDGANVSFPAGTDRETIRAAMQRHYGGPNPKASAKADAERRVASTPGFVRAVSQGASFNLSDEMDAAGAALETGARNLLARVGIGERADYGMRDAYDAVMEADRSARETYAREHPAANLAYILAGGFGAPGAIASGKWVAGAPSLPVMAGRGAVVGGASGAAYGAGEDDKDRVRGAVSGGVAGAVVGGAAPVVVQKVGRTATRIGGDTLSRAKAITARARGETAPPVVRIGPQLRAAQAIEKALARDAAAGHEPDLAQPLRHSGGENTSALFDVVAQSPGPGRQVIREAVDHTRDATGQAIRQDIAEAMGGHGDYFAHLDELKAARSEAARRGMAEMGDNLVSLDDGSVLALRSNLARSAIRDATENALASPEADIRAAGAALNRLHDELLDGPGGVSLRVRDAQDISRALLDAADVAYRAGDGARGAALKALGRSVRTNAATPERGGFAEYGDWLQQYGDDSDNIAALELGRGVFSGRRDMSAERLAKLHGEMSEAAQDQFRKGVAEAILDEVQRKGDILAVRRLMGDKAQEFRSRIRLAFPSDEAFEGFLSRMMDRSDAAARDARLMGGSPTYGRQAARADLEAEGPDVLGIMADAATMNIRPLASKALREALKVFPRASRSALSDPEANAALGRAASQPEEVERLMGLLVNERRLRTAPRLAGRAAPALGLVSSRANSQ